MKAFFLLLLSACCCFGQAFSFNDPAFMGQQTGSIGVPPTNVFVEAVGNPIPGLAQSGVEIENFVLDPVTKNYFAVCTGTNVANGTYGVGLLVNAGDPKVPSQWTYASNLITVANSASGICSPCLFYCATNAYWYCYYVTNNSHILYSSNRYPWGPFTDHIEVMATSGTTNRLLETYVFQRPDTGGWINLYMQDTDTGILSEQVGYATASGPGGPWTPYSGNPFIGFGSAGTYDAGTTADPWCVYWNGGFYIGYACAVGSLGWQTAVGWTPDFVTFNKLGLIARTNANASAWNHLSMWRGAVTKVGREYVLTVNGQNGVTGVYPGISTSPADTNAPVLNTIAAAPDVLSAVVSFNSDVNANCGVACGTSSGTYSATNAESAGSNFTHTVSMSGLQPSTTYYYVVLATNVLSTVGTVSPESTFATASIAGTLAAGPTNQLYYGISGDWWADDFYTNSNVPTWTNRWTNLWTFQTKKTSVSPSNVLSVLNGYSGLSFAGGQYLTNATYVSAQPSEWVFVFAITNNGFGGASKFFLDSTNASYRNSFGNSGTSLGVGAPTIAASFAVTTTLTNRYIIVETVFNTTASFAATNYANGATVSAGTEPMSGVTLGSYYGVGDYAAESLVRVMNFTNTIPATNQLARGYLNYYLTNLYGLSEP